MKLTKEDYFDLPMTETQMKKFQSLADKMLAEGFKISENNWLQTQSKEFYHGMHCMMRIAISIIGHPMQEEILNKIALEILVIHKEKINT